MARTKPKSRAEAMLCRRARRDYASCMAVRSLFPTLLYDAEIADPALLDALAHSIRSLARDDAAGIGWSRDKGYRGYTSYASLERPSPPRPGLRRSGQAAGAPRRQVRRGRRLQPKAQAAARQPVGQSVEKRWTSQWAHPSPCHHFRDFLRRGPAGLGRHPLRGPAPAADDGRAAARRHVRHRPAGPGLLLLWESWLRHEVLAGTGKGERLSISFNFA